MGKGGFREMGIYPCHHSCTAGVVQQPYFPLRYSKLRVLPGLNLIFIFVVVAIVVIGISPFNADPV